MLFLKYFNFILNYINFHETLPDYFPFKNYIFKGILKFLKLFINS